MNFAFLFHMHDKSIESIPPESFNPGNYDPANFAWADFDISQTAELKTLFAQLGLPEEETSKILDPKSVFYFQHKQNIFVDHFSVCRKQGKGLTSSPLIIVMTAHLIVTVHDGPSHYVENVLKVYGDSFQSVGKSPGFIFFLIWDAMIDGFLPLVFNIDEKLEQLENRYLHGNNSKNILDEIIGTKKMVRTLKHSLAPMQRSMRHLVSAKLELISDEARKYLMGHFEHLDRLAGTIDSLQDRVHSTLAGYNSLLSQQINNSMKILAIIATIMMPLSLLAAIYGTNFKYIPEITWKYGYFAFWGVLLFVGFGMLFLFKRKKWL